MSAPNGYLNGAGSGGHAYPPVQVVGVVPEQTRELIAQLEVPFDSAVIEWRVTNTSKDRQRGQVVPYADQRAYTDRLNALFTPSGWTRNYAVHTSPNFERSKDQKTVAKVFVTCTLTIFGIGAHSATGEEWADDQNALTSAEAQSFKRACSCFGLGRYLYYFTGLWVDLDERKRPKPTPVLFGWATPDGWRKGLRPQPPVPDRSVQRGDESQTNGPRQGGHSGATKTAGSELTCQIAQMRELLGTRMYRGLLKSVAKAWSPEQIPDTRLQHEVLKQMQVAERCFQRLDVARDRVGDRPLEEILRSLKIRSVDQVGDLTILGKIVLALEAVAGR
jgi:hypothetical protein